MNESLLNAYRCRADYANLFLEAIAGCGRGFFGHDGKVSRLEVDDRGRIWFIDSCSGKRIYTHYRYEWRGFTNGGTMRQLVDHLCTYVRTGECPRLNLGPWPDWVCDGDLWAYGDDMEIVRKAASNLVIHHGETK